MNERTTEPFVVEEIWFSDTDNCRVKPRNNNNNYNKRLDAEYRIFERMMFECDFLWRRTCVTLSDVSVGTDRALHITLFYRASLIYVVLTTALYSAHSVRSSAKYIVASKEFFCEHE